MTGFIVSVFRGSKRPELVKSVGMFGSHDAAEAYCTRVSLELSPSESEWAVIYPNVPLEYPEAV